MWWKKRKSVFGKNISLAYFSTYSQPHDNMQTLITSLGIVWPHRGHRPEVQHKENLLQVLKKWKFAKRSSKRVNALLWKVSQVESKKRVFRQWKPCRKLLSFATTHDFIFLNWRGTRTSVAILCFQPPQVPKFLNRYWKRWTFVGQKVKI